MREGLAQFYTDVVTRKLWPRAPGAFPAYEKLLNHQSGPYHAHEQWLKVAPHLRSEAVRFAMLRARALGSVTNAGWQQMLIETQQELRTA